MFYKGKYIQHSQQHDDIIFINNVLYSALLAPWVEKKNIKKLNFFLNATFLTGKHNLACCVKPSTFY